MLAVSFFSLFLSAILLQLSSGGIGPLDALSGVQLGFTSEQIGLIGSAHFAGFFLGCWWSPRLMSKIGHSRAFAVFAASGTVGILAHTIWLNPYAWAAMRILSGMCIAGCFTVLEAWLQAKITNENRGRSIGMYRTVDLCGAAASQLLIAVLDPVVYLSYNILAIICCASLLPLALTRVKQPSTAPKLRLRPMLGYKISPLASLAVIVSGVTSAAFRMVGPIFGVNIGLSAEQIGLFLAFFILGGILSQYPAGWLADRFDRRKVVFAFSMFAIGVCYFMIWISGSGVYWVLTGAVLFGASTFPIYSIASAHANDFIDSGHMVELNASLLFYFAIGAIISPLLISSLISAFGPSAMFTFIAAAHIVLCALSLVRMLKPQAEGRKEYTYMPRTSLVIARLFKRNGK